MECMFARRNSLWNGMEVRFLYGWLENDSFCLCVSEMSWMTEAETVSHQTYGFDLLIC